MEEKVKVKLVFTNMYLIYRGAKEKEKIKQKSIKFK